MNNGPMVDAVACQPASRLGFRGCMGFAVHALACFALLFVGPLPAAHAQTRFTWRTTVSPGNWGTGSSWEDDVAPTDATTTDFLFSGNQVLSATGAAIPNVGRFYFENQNSTTVQLNRILLWGDATGTAISLNATSGAVTISGTANPTTDSQGRIEVLRSQIWTNNSSSLLSIGTGNGNFNNVKTLLGSSTEAATLTLRGSGPITLGLFRSNTTSPGGALASGVTYDGTGLLTLTGTQTQASTGFFTINSGTVRNERANAVTGLFGSGTFTINGGAFESPGLTTRIYGGPTLQVSGTNLGSIVNWNNSFSVNSGTVNFGSTSSSEWMQINTGSVPLTITVTQNASLGVLGQFHTSGAAQRSLISGTSQIIKSGPGVMVIQYTSGTGFSGGFKLSEGELQFNSIGTGRNGNTMLGTGTFTIAGGTISRSGIWNQEPNTGNVNQRWEGNFTIGGTQSWTLGSGTVTLANNPIVTVLSSGVTYTVGGPIVGSSGFTKDGPGRLTLNGTSTFTGTTTLSSGTLQLGSGLVLPNSIINTNGEAVLTFTPTTTAVTFGGLSGTRNLVDVMTGNFTNGNSITLNPQAGISATYSGTIGNRGSNLALTKTGPGEQILSAVNTYTGLTTVSAGRLTIGGGNINASSGVTVNGLGAEFRYNSSTAFNKPLTLTQGILSGTGTIDTAVSVGANAIISPGNSPGSQTYTSSQWLQDGTYQWELNALTGTPGTNWDQVVITNLLDLTGLSASNKFNIDITTLTGGNIPGPLPYDGGEYTFQFVSFGSLSVPAPFSNAADSDLTSLFNIGLSSWSGGSKPSAQDISVKVNSTGTGLNLVIMAVPEPATIALAAIGISVAAFGFRRRRAT